MMTLQPRISWLDTPRLLVHDRTATANIEYSLIAALVSVGVLSCVCDLGMIVKDTFGGTAEIIGDASDNSAR